MDVIMVMQFPTAHNNEFLVSTLAPFVARQGLKNDKAVLELLFSTRNIFLRKVIYSLYYRM